MRGSMPDYTKTYVEYEGNICPVLEYLDLEGQRVAEPLDAQTLLICHEGGLTSYVPAMAGVIVTVH